LSLSIKEYNFLKETCLTALCLDKNVKFVGALDNNGKLLAGEFNKYKFFGNNDTLTIKSSIFYLHYLIPALNHQRKMKRSGMKSIQNNNVFLFDLADLGDSIYLAVTPLTEKKDRYLCIYLELCSSSSSSEIMSHEQIISKISDIL
jgi:hypothetical protein